MIDSIQIICERHSGSNWFAKLLEQSFPNIQVNDLEKHWFINEYKLKHFLETSYSPIKKMKQHCINRGINFNTFNNITTDNVLTIILTRNVYDWVLGMKRDPHHFKNKQEISNMSVSDFIKMDWNNVRDINEFSVPVENVIDLRTKKYLNWFKYIPTYCKNVEVISYESLLNKYIDVLVYLSNKYNFSINNIYQDYKILDKKKNQSIYFNPSLIEKYYSKKDLFFIEKYIKLELEKNLSY